MTTHYVYQLERKSAGNGPVLYIGVRSSKFSPNADPYMGSSNLVAQEIKDGRQFVKTILGVYETREEAERAENEFHEFHDVGINPNFYNLHNGGGEKSVFGARKFADRDGNPIMITVEKAQSLGLKPWRYRNGPKIMKSPEYDIYKGVRVPLVKNSGDHQMLLRLAKGINYKMLSGLGKSFLWVDRPQMYGLHLTEELIDEYAEANEGNIYCRLVGEIPETISREDAVRLGFDTEKNDWPSKDGSLNGVPYVKHPLPELKEEEVVEKQSDWKLWIRSLLTKNQLS